MYGVTAFGSTASGITCASRRPSGVIEPGQVFPIFFRADIPADEGVQQSECWRATTATHRSFSCSSHDDLMACRPEQRIGRNGVIGTCRDSETIHHEVEPRDGADAVNAGNQAEHNGIT